LAPFSAALPVSHSALYMLWFFLMTNKEFEKSSDDAMSLLEIIFINEYKWLELLYSRPF
jgi:hypothetical protein